MNRGVTTVILSCLVALLAFLNLVGIGAFLWQRSQIQSLRRELAIASEQVARGQMQSPTAKDVCRAARDGDLSVLKSILDAHPEFLNAKASLGGPTEATPLHFAVSAQRIAIVQELLRRNADVNALNSNGATPLHDCSSRGTFEIAILLLKGRSDVNVRNRAGQTPLGIAIQKNRREIGDLLIGFGAKE